MDIFVLIVLAAVAVILPIALFMAVIAVAVLIWIWRRIGPYFVNLGRWSGDWRNFIPLSCAGLVGVIVLIVLAAVLPAILRYIILGFLILGAIVFIIFATIVWTVRFLRWFWPRYRVRFWNAMQWLWDLLWKGIPGQMEKRMPGGSPPARRPPPKQPLPPKPQSTIAGGSPPPGARQPPVKRSWLDFEWLWRLIWGSPQPGQRKAGQTKASTGQPSQPAAVRSVGVAEKAAGRPKAGLRPLSWRLGLLVGEMRAKVLGQPAKKAKAASAAKPGTTVSSQTAPASPQGTSPAPQVGAVSGRKRTLVESVRDQVSDTADRVREWLGDLGDRFRRKGKAGAKKTTVGKSSSTASVTGGAKAAGKGFVGAVQSGRKAFWVGLFWVADRGRASVDVIRRLLRLDKK